MAFFSAMNKCVCFGLRKQNVFNVLVVLYVQMRDSWHFQWQLHDFADFIVPLFTG